MNQVDQFEKEKERLQNSMTFVETNVTDEAEKQKQLEQLKKTYVQTLKMYLSPAIQTLNQAFSCQYKTSKIEKGYDVNFNKIETSIPKSKEELVADMKHFQSILNTLDEANRKSAELAIEIISTYYELDLNMQTNAESNITFVEREEPKIIPQKPTFDDEPVVQKEEAPKKKKNPILKFIGNFLFFIVFLALLVVCFFIGYYFFKGEFPMELPFLKNPK